MLPKFFKPEALRGYIGIMDETAERHFTSFWESNDQVIVFPLAKQYTFWIACRVFISIDDPDHVAKFAYSFDLLAAGIISVPIDLPGTPFNRAIKAANTVRTELAKVIQHRKIDIAENKVSPTQDILSCMLTTKDENGKFTGEMHIPDNIIGLLVGGHDTASATCTFIVKYLAELPHIYDLVHRTNEDCKLRGSRGAAELGRHTEDEVLVECGM